MTTLNKDHILIFPFMAKGHTIPLIDLTHSLLDLSLRVTFITTPINLPFILRSLPPPFSALQVLTIPFPSSPLLPPSCQSTDHLPSPDLYPTFLHLTKLLRRPFHDLLQNLSSSGDLPLCVISDFFLGWTLDVCHHFHVPRLVSHGMSAFSMAICKSLWLHSPYDLVSDDDEPFVVPGSSLRLTWADVPVNYRLRDSDDPVFRFVDEAGKADVNSWGVIVNSFADLDGDYVGLFESFYRAGARAWLVGPLLLARGGGGESEVDEPDVARVVEWLDQRPGGSVVYVSFGTQTHLSDGQLDEIARGLEMSGYDFVWAVRSKTWVVPDGLEGRGLVLRGWAPQRRVLTHRATGGFMGHCGWNSVLEGLSAGKPMLAWPMIAEQHLNAKFVVDELRAGLRIPTGKPWEDGFIVERAVIAEGVKELMGREKGEMVRERARELAEAAQQAVKPGGSSYMGLSGLIEELRRESSGPVEPAEVTQREWTPKAASVSL
ncbi:UDP-glycosyltransferase 73B4 [Acorus gramineus]|uniref:Glycosyltransferase n=1 Tax=Acorus gramineus TaxID=55184 RepID=A0AAV9AV84_ACOGR|nr:UDP-glycosyltransferase 73B4 [Acorus gramineus]